MKIDKNNILSYAMSMDTFRRLGALPPISLYDGVSFDNNTNKDKN